MENTVKAKTIFDEYFDSTKLAKFTPALIVAGSIFCLIFLKGCAQNCGLS